MTIRNWIELAVLFIVVVIGIVLLIRSKRSVNDIEGFGGLIKKSEFKGRIIGGETKSVKKKK